MFPEGQPSQVVVVMMMMMEVMRRIQRWLLAISQGRSDTIDYLQLRLIGIQHTTFFYAFFFFFYFP